MRVLRAVLVRAAELEGLEMVVPAVVVMVVVVG